VTAEVRLLSVNVGLPAFLALHRGRPVRSGIAKGPVTTESIEVGVLNLAGDGQADLEVHGGEDKAVYAYPSEHIATWSAERGESLGPAAFGENLTVEGWLESDVCIGDRWAWGAAVLEVCQPRWPCYKLGLHRGDQGILARLRSTGRTGWYLRVLETGSAPVAGPITVALRHPAGVTVAEVHEARLHGTSPQRRDELIDLEPLAEEWRWNLRHRG
jgi:MOSC domain-containing protein YiiM